jgi:hypothetical protein
MGYNKPQWKFVNKSFREVCFLKDNLKLPKANIILKDENYYGKEMLELGCQQIREELKRSLRSKSNAISYFRSIGIRDVSIDIKGCNYSKIVDLRKPIDEKYHNKFDIITNSGTTEHIIPLNGQYQAFKNIHMCAKKGAVIIHILPGIGKYYGHCQTYYDYKFFKQLAKLNNYKIILLEPVKNRKTFLWIGVCFIKKENNNFSEDKNSFYQYIQFIDKKEVKKHKKNKKKYMV